MSTIPCHVKHLSHADQFLYIDQRKIEAAHPTHRDEKEARSAAYSAWNVALILVGEREAKHDLVDLVGYLIDQNTRLETTLLATRRAARAGMDAAKRTSTIQLELAEKARAESSPDVLASERAANAILTRENEQMHALLERLLETVDDQRMRDLIKDALHARPQPRATD